MKPWWPLVVIATLGACAPVLPRDPVERALVRDLARVVEIRTSTGWVTDEVEILNAMSDVMKSACQVDNDQRARALAWLDEQIAFHGGSPEAVWRAHGKSMSAVSDLLPLVRNRALLARADEWARQGRCAFWLEASPRFTGVQTQGHRFILTIEGGARVTNQLALGGARYGGGGSGRILGGYAFADRWAVTTGFEMGGDARFADLELGQLREFPELVAFAAWPVVLRYQFGLSAHAEVEAGPLVYSDQASANGQTGKISASFETGIRTGIAIGGTYLRLARGLLPKFSVAITLDVIPAVNGHQSLTQLGVGVRTGLDLSRWHDF